MNHGRGRDRGHGHGACGGRGAPERPQPNVDMAVILAEM
jgi:hypothetical protein